MPLKLPTLPDVPGTDPRAVLDSFKVAIAKRVADALPPLTVEKVYQGVDYGKKGVDFTIALPRFRLPGKVDVLAKTVIDQVCTGHVSPGDLTHDKSDAQVRFHLYWLDGAVMQFQADDFVESVTRATRHSCTLCSRRRRLSALC